MPSFVSSKLQEIFWVVMDFKWTHHKCIMLAVFLYGSKSLLLFFTLILYFRKWQVFRHNRVHSGWYDHRQSDMSLKWVCNFACPFKFLKLDVSSWHIDQNKSEKPYSRTWFKKHLGMNSCQYLLPDYSPDCSNSVKETWSRR